MRILQKHRSVTYSHGRTLISLAKGVPAFLKHIPVLGGLLRGASAKAITRISEDTNAAVGKASERSFGIVTKDGEQCVLHQVVQGQAAGKSVGQVLAELCGNVSADEPGHTITSHQCEIRGLLSSLPHSLTPSLSIARVSCAAFRSLNAASDSDDEEEATEKADGCCQSLTVLLAVEEATVKMSVVVH